MDPKAELGIAVISLLLMIVGDILSLVGPKIGHANPRTLPGLWRGAAGESDSGQSAQRLARKHGLSEATQRPDGRLLASHVAILWCRSPRGRMRLAREERPAVLGGNPWLPILSLGCIFS